MFKPNRKMLAAQFFRFNLVGVLNTAIDFVLFTLFIWLGVYYLLAQILSYGAGMVNSFLLNNRYTFNKGPASEPGTNEWKKRLRFAAWNGIVLGISLLLLAALTKLFSMDDVVAKAVVTVVTVGLNFYGSRKWVFVQQQAN
ncbi:MAG: GtrA family protein [Bacillota bacterium]